MACASWLMNLGFGASAVAAESSVEMSYVVMPSHDPKVIERSIQKLNLLLEKIDSRITTVKDRLDNGGL